MLESARCPYLLFINLCFKHLLDALPHVQDGLRRLVQTQNRKHTPHLRKLIGHVRYHFFVLRISKKTIEGFFNVTE